MDRLIESRMVGIALWVIIITATYLIGMMALQPESEKEYIALFIAVGFVGLLAGAMFLWIHWMFMGTV